MRARDVVAPADRRHRGACSLKHCVGDIRSAPWRGTASAAAAALKITRRTKLPRRVCCAQPSAMLGQHVRAPEQAQGGTAPSKNSCDKQVSRVVTLIRTDTTLDHRQKAEKVCSPQRWRQRAACLASRGARSQLQRRASLAGRGGHLTPDRNRRFHLVAILTPCPEQRRRCSRQPPRAFA